MEGPGVAVGVLVDVVVRSRSSTTVDEPDFRRERRLLLFVGVIASSPPDVCSLSVCPILSFSRLRSSWRAATRSPPATVLFLPNLDVPCADGELDIIPKGESIGSVPPVSLCMAIVRAAALFERKRPCRCRDCKASSDGMGVDGDVPGYVNGDMADCDICICMKYDGMGDASEGDVEVGERG